VLLGHATLSEMCGGTPSFDDVEMLRIAAAAWHDAEREADRKAANR
jgi:hypothetical protein